MTDGIIYIISITLLIALAGLAFWITRQSLGASGLNFFQNKQRRRLGVQEAASVDGRRRLVLVRRDNVEHLIMIGGPVDVVVETGIQTSAHLTNGLGDGLVRVDDSLDGDRETFEAREEPLRSTDVQLDSIERR